MKFFLIIILSYILLLGYCFASSDIYVSDFIEINIQNEIILDAKNREIEKIKYITLNNIFDKILNKKNLIKIKRKVNLQNEINYLIKDINIEDEFISSNKYSAKIKINYNKNAIIELMRNNKINYSDTESSKILLIFSHSNKLTKEGLSTNNKLYKKMIINKYKLLNFTYPLLTTNDRFILPYNKIINKNKKSLQKIANKYNSKFIIILNIMDNNSKKEINIHSYTKNNNSISTISKFEIDSEKDFIKPFLDVIDNWWKEFNMIENNIINMDLCVIRNSNIHELYFLKSKILALTQVKSFDLMQINNGLNMYKLVFYGKYSILSNKLKKDRINFEINKDQECIISNLN